MNRRDALLVTVSVGVLSLPLVIDSLIPPEKPECFYCKFIVPGTPTIQQVLLACADYIGCSKRAEGYNRACISTIHDGTGTLVTIRFSKVSE